MALLNRCPACGSKKVMRVATAEGCFYNIMLLGLIITIIGIPLAALIPKPKETMKCRNCGAKWQ